MQKYIIVRICIYKCNYSLVELDMVIEICQNTFILGVL